MTTIYNFKSDNNYNEPVDAYLQFFLGVVVCSVVWGKE